MCGSFSIYSSVFLSLFLSLAFPVHADEDFDVVRKRLLTEEVLSSRGWGDGGILNIYNQEEKRKALLELEDRINSKVFGQEGPVRTTSNLILRAVAGLNNPEKPWGCLLYLGPTGVGKTELAKVVATELYGNSDKMLRLNMSEYSNEGGVWALIGSSPGYVNHEQGGVLTNFLHANYRGIILLDEMEKADPAVLKLFLHVFDEGILTDNDGELLDCREYIFIMTSNLCSQEIVELYQQGHTSEEVIEEIQPHLMRSLSPELYNRVQPVAFSSLQPNVMGLLVRKQLAILTQNALNNCGISFTFSDDLVDYLAVEGFSDVLGARPLQRLIDDELVTFLAVEIVYNGYGAGYLMDVGYDGETFSVDATPPKEPEEKSEECDGWTEY